MVREWLGVAAGKIRQSQKKVTHNRPEVTSLGWDFAAKSGGKIVS